VRRKEGNYSVVLLSNSSGFARASVFVLRIAFWARLDGFIFSFCTLMGCDKWVLSERIISRSAEQKIMKSLDVPVRVYVLVEIQPGKEKEFADEILSKGLILDSRVERMDFVHGSFDLVVVLNGAMKDVDARVMAMRKSPFVRRTETLICFEMFTWEDLSGRLNE
jgi:hypothetical protein